MKSVKIIVSGRVQGVFYRDSTRRMAQDLGISGTVRNLPDGSVMIEAEGEEPNVQALIDWCRMGPPGARVDDLQVSPVPPKGFSGFVVLR